jgi:hypothetical protein
VDLALAAIEVGTNPDARREMKLHAALGVLLMYLKSAVPAAGAAWTRAFEFAHDSPLGKWIRTVGPIPCAPETLSWR